ncbi:hypothetical protein CYLTODRAFT_459549 [Cylindrobasidium torrendii FP15055 ss-10]|uniref:Uncharacterized protein n=1 Tax=Cylindrobasidium torrendii FP15055 ss-10 TaxID=1314674 RepID=A0A0D7AWZ5_9AGAR|nr:hypothetical protein CYLTODRAFT_459549 [Cylindrobasidium torrendii FP15055 ss-10]
MSSPSNAQNFDVHTASPAENTIKAFVERYSHASSDLSSLGLDELMAIAGVLRQASAIIEATKDSILAFREFTPAELRSWFRRRQLTIQAYDIIHGRATDILLQEFASDDESNSNEF